MVTTCVNCKLRVFDSSCILSQIPLLTANRHNTNAGRWLMRFQGVWDPKKKIVFIVGSRVHPRWVERSTRQERLSFLFGENVLYLCVLSVFCILPDMFCLDVISVEGYMFLCIKKVLSYRVGSTICSNCCVGKEPSGSLSLVHLLCNVLTFSNCIIAFSVRLCRM